MPNGEAGSRDNPEFRPTARVLLIDENDRALLVCATTPNRRGDRLWMAPGGGLDPGETHEAAALRELYEETGLRAKSLGPCIWKRRHIWQWETNWIESDEWFYLLRAPAFEAVQTVPDEWEMQYLIGARWWTLTEIQAARDEETFVPRSLPELLPPILAGEIPDMPIDVGA